jgi:TatD DNase family protein
LQGSVEIDPNLSGNHLLKLWDSPNGLEKCQQPEVVAIGPCGLDYHRDISDCDTQKEMFRRQIKLACDLQKPILVHERSAQEDVMEILSR